MIDFSFSSVLMTVFMSNVLLIILSVCFLNDSLLVNIRYKLLAIFCTVTLLRFLFPFELPITQTIPLGNFQYISNFIQILRYPYIFSSEIRLSIWDVFCIIWILGILFFMIKFLLDCKDIKVQYMKDSQDITESELCASVLKEFCSEKQLKRVRVYKAPNVDGPMIIGLRNMAILLPPDTVSSEFHTVYALQHELFHFTHHDLWLKFAVNCLVIAYWWNPFGYFMNRQVDILLEMRVDAKMISGDKETAEGYLLSLKDHVSGRVRKSNCANQTIGLCIGGKSALNRRIKMMQCLDKRPNYPASIAMFILIVGIYILSYLFVFEGYYHSPEMEENCITLDAVSCYVIINENGLYDVYFGNGIFIETTDTLQYYPPNIMIYSSEEEYYEKE